MTPTFIDGRIVVAGDHPQAYGRDLFHEASRASRTDVAQEN